MFLAEYITSVTTWALASIQSKVAPRREGCCSADTLADWLVVSATYSTDESHRRGRRTLDSPNVHFVPLFKIRFVPWLLCAAHKRRGRIRIFALLCKITATIIHAFHFT